MASRPDSPEHPTGDETIELQIPEPSGVRIGPYKLIEKIGAGGMGEIYLGEDERLNRKVALKLLPAQFTQDADRVRRFELEAKAASALNHPNIITIYEIGEADGAHYIVTEYIEGQTLRQRMIDHLPIGMALDVGVQMASALKAAHDVGIVHRDIKPENVMVRPDGLVKVLDFGIAKLVERPSAPLLTPSGDLDQATVALDDFYVTKVDPYARVDPYKTTPEEALNETAAGVIMGTVTYMSPEQLRGQKVDARADIFSLGVVLYEVIAGRSPFAGSTQFDRIAAILEREPAPLGEYRSDMPPGLERIVSKALRKDRDARYQFVDDLLGDINDLKQELEFQAILRRSSQPDASDQSAAGRRPEAGSRTSPDAVGPGQVPAKPQQDLYNAAVDVADDLRAAPDLEAEARELQFRTMANSISQLAWMADHEGYIFWYNDRWYDYTGTTLEQMQGWGWQKVHHPDEVDRVVARIKVAFATGEPWEDTFPLRSKAGEYRWFLSRALPICDADGRVMRWFGTNTDITEQRQMEQALRESRDELEQRVAARTDREAERRQVTLLVCGSDLFESEAYSGLDTEEQVRVLGAFEHVCQEPLRKFGGTVVQCNEKGLLACFGFPVAYENAARRAARAGQAILDVMKPLGEQFRLKDQLDLNPWVGIHTGPAIVELKAGVVSLVGEARNVAVRLEEIAVAGQVICTEASYRIFQGRFQCATLGKKKVKGISQPLEMFRVERIAIAGSLFDAVAPAELSPLTGRDQEIKLLKSRWEQAQEGMGQVVLLIGESGLGKSRLVHAMKEHVMGQMAEGEVDAPVIEWRCSPQFQNTGLYPAIDFYERALGFDREEPAEARFDRLLERLEQYGLARPETVPLWASLLSLPTPDRFPPLSLPPVREREETFRTLLDWLHTRSSRKPILFIVEDLHWVDASTLEFLTQFLAEGLHDSILTLLTFRPEFKTPWPAVAHQTSLALNRLTRREVSEFVQKKTESRVTDELIGQIYERTGGVPLFVEEFTKMVQESRSPDSEGVSSSRMLLGREIPATLQDLMMARLDRMEGERELAQLAATLGREFSHELLAAVAALDEPTLQAQLAKLIQDEILYPKGQPPRCSYIFKHALLEDALYNAMVKGKRQQFHRRIAEVLERQFPQTVETQPELLAHHFTEAGNAERAVGFWLKAGLRCVERSANVEAIGHLTKGLALVRTFAESPERDARELQFLNPLGTPLGTTYIAAGGHPAGEVGTVFRRARELADRIGQQEQLFAVMWGNWVWHLVRGDFRLCTELAAEAMDLAQRLNDPGMLMEALFMPGVTLFYRGEFAEARAHLEKAVAEYDDRERMKFWTAYTGHNAGVTNRCYLALTLWHLGYPDQALKLDREMRDLARTIGHPFSLGHALDFGALLHQNCRLGAGVLEAAEEEMSLGKEQGFSLWNAFGALHVASGMLLHGQRAEAEPLLLKGLSAYRATGAEIRLPYYLGMVGEAYTLAAHFEAAHEALNEGFAVAEKNDDRFAEAELHRLLGELHLAETDDQAAAEESFRTAIQTARRQQSRAWELRATTSLARLLQRQGRRDEARDALAAVYALYTEGFTTPDLVDAKALLETLS